MTQTRDALIKDAFYKLRAYGFKATPQPEELEFAARELNDMLHAWQPRGFKIWAVEDGQIFLVDEQKSYNLNSSTGSHSAKTSDVITTTISADEALGQTVISLTSTTGMVAGDFIGILLDDATQQWTTIVSVDSTTQVTITASLTAAASAGNTVYTYTTKLVRPIQIIEDSVRLKRGTDDNEFTVQLISRTDYLRLLNKDSSSIVTQAYYDSQLTTGVMYVYPTSDNSNDRLYFSYKRDFVDMDDPADTFDYPAEYNSAIKWGLALRLAPTVGIVDQATIAEIKMFAIDAYREALLWDQEMTPIRFRPGI